MKTMNKILQSLIFTMLFFGVPALMGLFVLDGILHFLLLWAVGFAAIFLVLVLIFCFVGGLAKVWK
ncbi:MAG TPA: hypothetical protein ENI07_01190 [Desulfobacterales bacterium]|nr:hypothetical protein [Desulfobacterales bacterium]